MWLAVQIQMLSEILQLCNQKLTNSFGSHAKGKARASSRGKFNIAERTHKPNLVERDVAKTAPIDTVQDIPHLQTRPSTVQCELESSREAARCNKLCADQR